ncbi:PH domain-containing protein [Micromonospora sp. NPDC047074]|uniref:PH domain-containing protein n=1 Tax=Micromonospora sp. NPDC047074 TaxID=3154339 RepID=UPI0033E2F314
MPPAGPGPTAPVRPSPVTAAAGPRLLVAAALAIAAAWTVTVTAWEPPGFWAGLLLRSVPFGLALLACAVSVWATGDPWRRPAELALPGGARLRVPPVSGFAWLVAGQVLVMVSATSAVVRLEWLDGPDAPPAPLRYAALLPLAGMVAVAALLIGALVAAVLAGSPRVDLTPHGIEVREPFGRRRIPWAALAPGTPARQESKNRLVLTVTRPELVERRGLPRGSRTAPRLALPWLRVHPWFLADAIRHHVDHPDERAHIGTPAGYERLHRAVTRAVPGQPL